MRASRVSAVIMSAVMIRFSARSWASVPSAQISWVPLISASPVVVAVVVVVVVVFVARKKEATRRVVCKTLAPVT